MAKNNYTQSKEWQEYLKLIAERPEAFRNDENLIIELDSKKVQDFVEKSGKKIGVVYSSPYNIMVVDLVSNASGSCFAYERLLPAVQGSAVVVIPCYKGSYVLLKQYRHALRDFQYAFPRGFGEVGLSDEENAYKELEEELGAQAITTKKLGTVVADSGMSGNIVSIFVCEIDKTVLKNGYEGICEMITLTGLEMENWIAEGKITDGFTLAAWALLKSSNK